MKFLNDFASPAELLFQDSASPLQMGIVKVHHFIMFYVVLIFCLVMWLLLRVIMLFRTSDAYNSTLDQFKKNNYAIHSSGSLWLEFFWTLIPALILAILIQPNVMLLYAQDDIINPQLTIKAIGHQWYWSYEYSDYTFDSSESIAFNSYLIQDSDLLLGELRLLEVDSRLVIPSNVHIRLVVSSTDVIHCFAVPSLGVKIDAIPGRLNQVPLFSLREGLFYGQCSEICGVNHGYMPIVVEAVSVDEYISWIKSKIQELV